MKIKKYKWVILTDGELGISGDFLSEKEVILKNNVMEKIECSMIEVEVADTSNGIIKVVKLKNADPNLYNLVIANGEYELFKKGENGEWIPYGCLRRFMTADEGVEIIESLKKIIDKLDKIENAIFGLDDEIENVKSTLRQL